MFKPGESGNKKGRPKKSNDRISTATREKLSEIFNNNLDRVPDELAKLNGQKFIDAMVALAPFIISRLQSNEHKVELPKQNTVPPELEGLTLKQIEEIENAQRLVIEKYKPLKQIEFIEPVEVSTVKKPF